MYRLCPVLPVAFRLQIESWPVDGADVEACLGSAPFQKRTSWRKGRPLEAAFAKCSIVGSSQFLSPSKIEGSHLRCLLRQALR